VSSYTEKPQRKEGVFRWWGTQTGKTPVAAVSRGYQVRKRLRLKNLEIQTQLRKTGEKKGGVGGGQSTRSGREEQGGA